MFLGRKNFYKKRKYWGRGCKGELESSWLKISRKKDILVRGLILRSRCQSWFILVYCGYKGVLDI